MEKKCPKCKELFVCNHNNIRNCHCAEVKLSEKQKAWIKDNFSNCLCNKCLREISNNI